MNYRIPIFWEKHSVLDIEASSLTEAINLALLTLPPEGEYTEGSLQVDIDAMDLIEENDHYRDKESLESYLDSSDSEDFRDSYFASLYGLDLLKVFDVPYWIEKYMGKKAEYRPGFHEPHAIGEIIEIDHKHYKYIDSQLLPEEIEHQAHDGSLVIEFRGPSFLRILEPVE